MIFSNFIELFIHVFFDTKIYRPGVFVIAHLSLNSNPLIIKNWYWHYSIIQNTENLSLAKNMNTKLNYSNLLETTSVAISLILKYGFFGFLQNYQERFESCSFLLFSRNLLKYLPATGILHM